MLHSVLLSCALLLACAATPCAATPLMVTVQTQSRQQMLKVATADTQRSLLGAMEVTQSSVVDVENVDALLPYDVTHVQNVPTLSLLDSLAFDNVTEEWSFTSETMALDSSEHGQINHYHRVLYFTHTAHDIGASDTANRCLQPGTDYESCLSYLRSDYVVLMDDPNINDGVAKDCLESTTWAAGQLGWCNYVDHNDSKNRNR
jgi:hypothetical protein